MNPFSFKITPILCLEIAWENSTAAAKRAGKLAVYNQKVSLFSGTSLGLLLKKAWSHLCPYRCQKFVLIHGTKGKGKQPLTPLMAPVWSWRLQGAWEDTHPRTQPIHLPPAQKQWFTSCAVTLKEGDSSQALTAKLICGAEVGGWQYDRDQWLFEVYLPFLQRSKLSVWAANTAVCSLPFCSIIPANYIIMDL